MSSVCEVEVCYKSLCGECDGFVVCDTCQAINISLQEKKEREELLHKEEQENIAKQKNIKNTTSRKRLFYLLMCCIICGIAKNNINILISLVIGIIIGYCMISHDSKTKSNEKLDIPVAKLDIPVAKLDIPVAKSICSEFHVPNENGILVNSENLIINDQYCPHLIISDNCESCIRKRTSIERINILIAILKYKGPNRVRIPGDGFCSLWALYTYILLSINNSDFNVKTILDDIEIMKIMVDTGATIKQAISQIFQLSIDTQDLDIYLESLPKFQKLYGKINNNVDIDIGVISNININIIINNSIKYSYILNSGNHFDLIHNDDTDFESFDISRLDALHWLLEQFSKYSDERQKSDPKELEQLCKTHGVNPFCGYSGCSNRNPHSHL